MMDLKTLETYFDFKKLKTTWSVEILAGVSTFLSLSYIFVVHPAILGQAGIDQSAALFATVIASGLATLFMGIWARLPFVLAPGLEMNAYVVFFLIGVLSYSWQEALGVVLMSGVLFLVITFLGIREKIIDSVPEKMKVAIAFAVGIFVLMIGLRISNIITYEGTRLDGLGAFHSPEGLVAFLGLGLIFILDRLKVPGSILLTILLASFYLNMVGFAQDIELGYDSATSAVMAFEIPSLTVATLSAIFTLFVIDFYGSIAKFIGLTMHTPINIKKRATKALKVDGAATVGGAILGTSSVTTYVESAVGIGVGGRTGVTAIVCAVLMLCMLFLLPVLSYIPVAATAPALLYVGYKLFPSSKIRESYDQLDRLILVAMGFVVVFWFSLDLAMLIGFGGYFMKAVLCPPKNKKSNNVTFLGLSAAALLIVTVLGYF